jgi:hypothetical protein
MPKLSKIIEAWTEVPDVYFSNEDNQEYRLDGDGARIKLRSFNAKDNTKLQQDSSVLTVNNMDTVVTIDRVKLIELTFDRRVLDFEDFLDEDSVPMDCNQKTKRQWAWESGYYAFVRERGQILDKIAAGKAKEEEKNLFDWPSTSATGKKSTQAAAKHAKDSGQKS